MSDNVQEPTYSAPPLGAYPVEEHLRAQQEQTHPSSGEPMHPKSEEEELAPAVADPKGPPNEDAGQGQGKHDAK